MQSLIKPMWFALEALLVLLNPVDEEVVWIYNSTWKLRIYDESLLFVNNKILYFRTLQTTRLPLSLPSHLSSLLTSLEKKKKQE